MKFSVVTICYNAAEMIRATMESVLCQQYTGEFEYIIVDGASRDNTTEIAQSYETKFAERGVKLRIYSAPDQGISDAFNKGVEYAQGEIVGLVNAGDHLTPDALRVLDDAYEPEVDVYYGNIWWVDEANGLRYIKKSEPTPYNLRHTMSIMHPACFIRKSAYQASGLYRLDYRYSMDRELLARMMREGRRFKYIDHEFSVMTAGGVSDGSAFSPQRKQESMGVALACGVPRWQFERTFFLAKHRYFLIKWIKEHTKLFPLLMRLKRR